MLGLTAVAVGQQQACYSRAWATGDPSSSEAGAVEAADVVSRALSTEGGPAVAKAARKSLRPLPRVPKVRLAPGLEVSQVRGAGALREGGGHEQAQGP